MARCRMWLLIGGFFFFLLSAALRWEYGKFVHFCAWDVGI